MPSRKSSPKTSSAQVHARFAAAEKSYAKAMKIFVQEQNWEASRDAFAAFIEAFDDEAGLAELVDRARLHMASCESKIGPSVTTPSCASDWLIEAVMLSNEGQFDEALTAFEKALAQGADRSKVYYARAAAMARAERSEDAVADLRLAIEADPDNRAYALGDSDFERVRELAAFVALVEPPADSTAPSAVGGPDGSEGTQDQDI